MADDRELERRLERLGTADSPELSDERLATLTARVTAATHAPIPHRRRTPMLAVAAALVIALVVGVALVSARGGDTRLDLADGVTLELPGGASEPGRPGDELPDGTIVSVAPGGSAVVDGRRYGPGRYLVDDGEITPLPTAATTSTTSTSGSTTTSEPGGSPTPERPPRDPGGTPTSTRPPGDDAPPSRTTTTTAPSDRPVDRPPSDGTRPPTTRPSDRRPDRPSTTRPTTTLPRTSTTRPADRPTTTSPRPTTTTTTTTTSTTTTPPDRTSTTTRDRPPGDRT